MKILVKLDVNDGFEFSEDVCMADLLERNMCLECPFHYHVGKTVQCTIGGSCPTIISKEENA